MSQGRNSHNSTGGTHIPSWDTIAKVELQTQSVQGYQLGRLVAHLWYKLSEMVFVISRSLCCHQLAVLLLQGSSDCSTHIVHIVVNL